MGIVASGQGKGAVSSRLSVQQQWRPAKVDAVDALQRKWSDLRVCEGRDVRLVWSVDEAD